MTIGELEVLLREYPSDIEVKIGVPDGEGFVPYNLDAVCIHYGRSYLKMPVY